MTADPMAIWRLRLRSLNSGRAISITPRGGNFRANARRSQMPEIKGDKKSSTAYEWVPNVRWEIALSIAGQYPETLWEWSILKNVIRLMPAGALTRLTGTGF